MADGNLTSMVGQATDNAYVKLLSLLAIPAMVLIFMQMWDGQKDQGKDINTLLIGQNVQASKTEDITRRIEGIERVQTRLLFGKPVVP